jgi:hypothetical protein
MGTTMFRKLRRATRFSLVMVLGLMGCEDIAVPAIQAVPDENGERRSAKNEVLLVYAFRVEGDQFTYISHIAQSHPLGPHGSSSGGYPWRPDIDQRLKYRVDVDNSDAKVIVFWNDVLVEEFEFGLSLFRSGQVQVIPLEDPDGTQIELHVWGSPDWPDDLTPNAVYTRDQIEELEGL